MDHFKSFHDAFYIANCTTLHDSSALRLNFPIDALK